ncbi:hypothetical protein COU14_00580 [Candidatus Kaiserbacteria bacterium CG10_big_fil_rev_8_21_14_0_10_44_10]|uniref:DUF1003 domain-containing protein n=1 Tax=Candidatus Kaiserbacteria bacterium CG10_big_fil_rev_8_21_14_0_10_44_10 TaxID=1974606 RepID=A0A2H0UIC0_9BACT|nr:MAG: hypothetical protein COU14_00580 [Candidatus Kaiserbacteria bacterium CG10_big_fil_rev_8_21_14_0_10_44_10]
MAKELTPIEKRAESVTKWIGSTQSITVHTILFTTAFLLVIFSVVSFDRMLLALTTVVSLEAIYLAIFIQMTINRQAEVIAEVESDIDDIQEDLDEIGGEMDEIIEDLDEWEEDDEIDDKRKMEQKQTLQNIYDTIQKLSGDIENLKK